MPDLMEQVDRFTHDILLDALHNAEARYWHGRAETFEAARPRPEDFTGNATPNVLEAQRERLTAQADASRTRARTANYGDVFAAVTQESSRLTHPHMFC